MSMVASSKKAAEVDRLNHQYVKGGLYVRHLGPLKNGDKAGPPVMAPADAETGSLHFLEVAGNPPMAFIWNKLHRSWERDGGHRMAFSAVYLASHGWRYVGPA